MDLSIRSATEADCDMIADAIAQSSGGYAQLGWHEKRGDYPGLDLLQIGARLYAMDKEPFTWRNCVVAQGEQPLGVMLAYAIDADYQSAEPDSLSQDGGKVKSKDKEENEGKSTDVYYPVKMEVANSWYICGMTVFEPWRGRGIGSRLLEFAAQQARQKGYPQLSLIAFEQNQGSVRLYLRNGFTVIQRRQVVPHPMIDYQGDVLLMTAPLS